MGNSITTEKVLVSGASGYIASWIVKYLLERGCQVHGTVRSLKKAEKVAHLQKLAKAYPNQLYLFEADLLSPNSFDEAMQGCKYVIHTASPFMTAVKNPMKDLVKPAVEGTKNILTSVEQIDTVERVVLTSSVVAIYGDAEEIHSTPNNMFTEEMWNGSSSLKHQPYSYSKTLAEKAAWEIVKKQSRWDMVTIHPGFVLGPSLSDRKDSTSMDFMISCLNGRFKTGIPDLHFGTIDVRDVAVAHIEAAFRKAAKGRYIACSDDANMLTLSEIMRKAYPELPIAKKHLPKILLYVLGPLNGFSWKFIRRNIGIAIHFDNSRTIKELGLNFRSLETTITDAAAYIVNSNLHKK